MTYAYGRGRLLISVLKLINIGYNLIWNRFIGATLKIGGDNKGKEHYIARRR